MSSASRSPRSAVLRSPSPRKRRRRRDEDAIGDTARLISDEAARLYDAMHSLIPRLAPLSLDALGLSATLENLVRDWQRRHVAVTIDLVHKLPSDLGSSVALAVYRVVQEGLINALRHAQATAHRHRGRRHRGADPCRASPTTASVCRPTGRGPGISDFADSPNASHSSAAGSRSAAQALAARDLAAEIPLKAAA